MNNSHANVEPEWQPKAIIFDLLTGLLNSWDIWGASTPSGSQDEGRRWRDHYLKITFAEGAYVPYEDMVRRAAQDVDLPESAPKALLRDWEKLAPWPEVGDVLRALRKRGYKLVVVTNCSKKLGNLAAKTVEKAAGGEGKEGEGEGEFSFAFDVVITAEESGFYKPAREAYEAALTATGIDASDALFVAGSSGDVQGATDAGMKVVWHNHVGLPKKGEAVPLKEGRSLDDALKDFL